MKTPRALRVAAMVLLAAPASAELFVTHADGVKADEGVVVERANLSIQTHLILRDVEYLKTVDRDAFRLPVSGTLRRGFADIRVLSQPLFDKILAAFRERTYRKKTFRARSIVFRVAAPRPLGRAVRVANVDVDFGGELLVTFGVVRSGEGFDVAYPTLRTGGKKIRVFDVLDAKLRGRLERAILERYRRSLPPLAKEKGKGGLAP